MGPARHDSEPLVVAYAVVVGVEVDDLLDAELSDLLGPPPKGPPTVTTTHTPQQPSAPTNTIGQLEERRRRRRLEHLLDVRSRLATLAVERRSHRLDDANDTFGQQLAVESAISDEFPDMYVERLGDWARHEAELEHEPPQMVANCGICQAIASRSGINLTPPEAA